MHYFALAKEIERVKNALVIGKGHKVLVSGTGFLLCSTADRKPAVLLSVTQMGRKEISPGTKTWGLSAKYSMKNPWIP